LAESWRVVLGGIRGEELSVGEPVEEEGDAIFLAGRQQHHVELVLKTVLIPFHDILRAARITETENRKL
jgi:hypothetical protein